MDAQQTHIEGMEPVRVPELDEIAAKYVRTHDKRMKLTGDEAELRQTLLDRMRDEGLTHYISGDDPRRFVVVVEESEEKVLIKKYVPPPAVDE